MIKDVNKSRSLLLFFGWQRGPRLKNTVGPAPGPHMQLWMKVCLRKLVGVARGPLWRGARLEAIGPIGSRPALTTGIAVMKMSAVTLWATVEGFCDFSNTPRWWWRAVQESLINWYKFLFIGSLFLSHQISQQWYWFKYEWMVREWVCILWSLRT